MRRLNGEDLAAVASLQMSIWSSRHWRSRTALETCALFNATELGPDCPVHVSHPNDGRRKYWRMFFSVGTIAGRFRRYSPLILSEDSQSVALGGTCALRTTLFVLEGAVRHESRC
jgi:hypothetical protein